MNICVIFGEYNYFDETTIKEIKQTKKQVKPDLMCVILNKYIANNGDFLNSNPVNYANLAIENGADLVLGIPSVFTLSNKEIYSFALLKILRLFGKDNKYFLACPIDEESLEYIIITSEMITSEGNDGFLGSTDINVNKAETQETGDLTNMITGVSNEIFIETYLNGLKSNLDIELIPVLKRYFRDDTEPFIDKNKYNLLSKNILATADSEIIKKNLEFISNGENDEKVAKKIAISLLLKFDLTKEKIIDYIMKLDKAEVLAIKNNKKRFIKGKGFVENIESSDILKELNTYETKIEELEKLIK